MCASQSGFDDRVTFRVERHRIDRRPVARLARPARRVLLSGLLVERMARIENGVILASVALGRADVLDAAVAVIVVVPMHELRRPGPGLIEAGKALGRELRPVLGGAKQRLGIGVVVAYPRLRVRGLDTQPVSHFKPSGAYLSGFPWRNGCQRTLPIRPRKPCNTPLLMCHQWANRGLAKRV